MSLFWSLLRSKASKYLTDMYCEYEELNNETSKRRVLKNVKFRQGAYGAHMAEETPPLPLVFFKSVIHKKI